MGCELSISLFPVSEFPLLISCISHPNLFIQSNSYFFLPCDNFISLYSLMLEFLWSLLAKSNIKHHWIIYPLLSHFFTWSGNQEVGNEKWGMRNEKLEMRNKKLGNCKMDLEWDWIGPREMGNGIQTRILVTEVLPSGPPIGFWCQ